MAYLIGNDLWFCHEGNCLVFLDLRNDRYFRLPPSCERAFIARMSDSTAPDLRFDQGRVSITATTKPIQENNILAPRRSALEWPSPAPHLRVSSLVGASIAIASTLRKLRTRPLQNTLAHMCLYRDRRRLSGNLDTSEAQAIEASRRFNRARLLIPIEPSCLLDSIALTMFLAKRGLASTVVFGVTCNPFSAHSWVQTGDLVLNDSVGNANTHTPIGIF